MKRYVKSSNDSNYAIGFFIDDEFKGYVKGMDNPPWMILRVWEDSPGNKTYTSSKRAQSIIDNRYFQYDTVIVYDESDQIVLKEDYSDNQELRVIKV